ncbi:NACHT domain-containing protein [Streptomyces sp. NBC_00236]|uniref:NACHT domain-containing protein n=1 Tax=Streptomyces sp. NBC_00236 TaxID=2903639 RepID=UPI002E2B58F3|nr:NACHT domain-containing protein [Streptomyces sp. NBC_00236]
MQGLEVALVRLATTVIGSVARSLITPKPGAGLVPDPVRPLPRPAKPDRLARVLAGRLAESYTGLPENERLAAVEAVQDTFVAAGELTADRLFGLNLDPDRLSAELSAPPAGLSDRAAGLYGELLDRCCAHAMEQLTAEPSFTARAAVEQVRAAERTRELVADVRERVGPRPGTAALDFERRYTEFMATAHSRIGLFGLTLGRSTGEWPLETGYISLSVSSRDSGPEWWEATAPERVTVTAEQALAGTGRLLLRGTAGSGKSTLVQWLAVNAARQTFGGDLADLNRCVPFVLRLRAFTSDGKLPGPEDFLHAAGVPLHGAAPAGWADRLLSEGRGLVLVDGVDEVPARLRQRTEKWLKDLLTAYPRSRYVVTTRPSAVPESWLSGSGFEAHSLMPMTTKDIRAFVDHWHTAARSECRSDEEREQLDAYEASLRHAVGTRRDLGRLATNPLMCALLCALNRDRRTQLPRARKELYDAALDMLLVRRDTERDVNGVEGVDLTREEQTALLQRLAYWLIRNGQAEAEHDEALAMVTEWLAAMSQIQGSPENVFQHLLIRSGLLREPAPGAVGFVHRTFQDYLGAKAAVEARDFGVLVRQAHDDQWHDVVQMAVGHARPDERGRLLRQLLKRADRTPTYRHRLVLLAAASVEHAPELDAAVRDDVRRRTEELLPPRTREEAEQLAAVGELVLELLPGPQDVEDEFSAGYVVMTAGLVGGETAYEVIRQYREDERPWVAGQLCEAWGAFDAETYAREILAAQAWEQPYVSAATAEQMSALRHVPEAHSVRLQGSHRDLSPLVSRRELRKLFVFDNRELTDISPVASMRSLTEAGFSQCPEVRDLSPLYGLPLTLLSLIQLHPGLSAGQLEPLTASTVVLGHRFAVGSFGELPLHTRLKSLYLIGQASELNLEGIERWTELEELRIESSSQLRYMAAAPSRSRLRSLTLDGLDDLDPAVLSGFPSLGKLVLFRCRLSGELTPLRELTELTTLSLYPRSEGTPADVDSVIDLTPLAALDRLTITVGRDTHTVGEDLFPPGRIMRPHRSVTV